MELLNTFFNIEILQQYFPMLIGGFLRTLALGFLSILLGLIGGLVLALVRLYTPKWIRLLAYVYIDVFRAIPVLVWLVLVYYALPFVGIQMSPFVSAVVSLTMISSAYAAEIYRAGIEAVPKGQVEAAKAIGLNHRDRMRDVVLPQALRIVIPPLTNNSINVMKDTALASVVAMPGLLKQAKQAQALAANPTPLIGAALLYLVMIWPLVRMVGVVERHYSQGRQ